MCFLCVARVCVFVMFKACSVYCFCLFCGVCGLCVCVVCLWCVRFVYVFVLRGFVVCGFLWFVVCVWFLCLACV